MRRPVCYFAPTFFFATGSSTCPLSFAAAASSVVAAAADADDAESSFFLSIFVTCAPAGMAFSAFVSSISMFCRYRPSARVQSNTNSRSR